MKNKYNNEFGKEILDSKNLIPDSYLEDFQIKLSIPKIKTLYQKFQLHEKQGLITHDYYISCMKSVFGDNSMKSFYLEEIYELIFLRFREIKCIIKNNKTVFYITNFIEEKVINSYNLACALGIFAKISFENKLKLIFFLTDTDEDNFLNREDIENMIKTINYLFCEEENIINTNSTILTQSLMNIKINSILKELFYNPGDLYEVLEKEQYITFDIFYECIKKIPDYKYKLIPCFINFKKCLYNIPKEKIIHVNNKYKKDFININSYITNEQNNDYVPFNKLKDRLNLKLSNLPTIFKPVRVKKDNINSYLQKERKMKLDLINSDRENDNVSNTSKNKRRCFFHQKEKSFKELLKESTIFENGEDKDNKKDFKKKVRFNSFDDLKDDDKYFFEASFNSIRNLEAEPAIIKFYDEKCFSPTTSRIIDLSNNNYHFKKRLNKNKQLTSIIKQKKFINFFEKNENDDKTPIHRNLENYFKKKFINVSPNNNVNIIDEKYTFKIDNSSTKMHNENLNEKFKENLSEKLNEKISDKQNEKINEIKEENKKLLPRKSVANLQKLSKHSSKIKNLLLMNKKYKNLNEVLNEINCEEKKFSFDSIEKICSYLIERVNNIKREKDSTKNFLGKNIDKKDMSFAFYKFDYNKLGTKRKIKIRSKSQSQF